MNANPTHKLDLISAGIIFYFIYPNIGIREKMNEMSIPTPYSCVPNTP